MVEQLRLLRKLNGYKTPGTPVMMAHRLALEQVAHPCQHVQALNETEICIRVGQLLPGDHD